MLTHIVLRKQASQSKDRGFHDPHFLANEPFLGVDRYTGIKPFFKCRLVAAGLIYIASPSARCLVTWLMRGLRLRHV
jgi:hypothetical protein